MLIFLALASPIQIFVFVKAFVVLGLFDKWKRPSCQWTGKILRFLHSPCLAVSLFFYLSLSLSLLMSAFRLTFYNCYIPSAKEASCNRQGKDASSWMFRAVVCNFYVYIYIWFFMVWEYSNIWRRCCVVLFLDLVFCVVPDTSGGDGRPPPHFYIPAAPVPFELRSSLLSSVCAWGIIPLPCNDHDESVFKTDTRWWLLVGFLHQD